MLNTEKITLQNIHGNEVAYSGTVTAVTHKTIVVFIPALDVEVNVQRNPDTSVQNGSVPEVGDIATVQIVLEDGDYIVVAAMFVPQQGIREGIPVTDDDLLLLDSEDEDTEEYDWRNEPPVEDSDDLDID